MKTIFFLRELTLIGNITELHMHNFSGDVDGGVGMGGCDFNTPYFKRTNETRC